MQVILPWPPKELSPNARLHWSRVAKAKKQYRNACWALALEAGINPTSVPGGNRYALELMFYPPDRRQRDHDNLIASMKAGLDGLADAMGVDDRKFRLTQDVSPDIGGYVRIEIKHMQ
jgi:crossover junction endodeoxyribonuclease RusA